MICLQLISLILDGVVGAVQDRMNSEHQCKPAHMMYHNNLWSCLILSTSMYYKLSKTDNESAFDCVFELSIIIFCVLFLTA